MEYRFTKENFNDEVIKSDVPVLVDFYADWCGPCKMMMPVVEELAKTYEGKAKVGKVNVDEQGELAEEFGVMSIPAFVVIKNGKVVDQALGAMAKAKLEAICEVSAGELSTGLIDHSESLLSKRHIEIVYNDFKEFNIDGNKVGLSQAVCKSKEEYDALKNELARYMEDACKSGGYDLMAIMLTNPNGSGSYVLSAGARRRVLNNAFTINKDGFVDGLVSRKKQLLPGLIKAMSIK